MPLICLNKPYRVLSQFSDEGQRRTLAEFVRNRRVYPGGRLDYDSEGLLLLTDDGRLQAAIAESRMKLPKHYWIQVEGIAEQRQVQALLAGVELKDGMARALQAEIVDEPEGLWPRSPPIRYRRSVPSCWLALAIDEGRNRQLRRMTAATGLPALRLIRYQVGPWRLGPLAPGELETISNGDAWQQLLDFRHR